MITSIRKRKGLNILQPGVYRINAGDLGWIEVEAKNGFVAIKIAQQHYRDQGISLQGRGRNFIINDIIPEKRSE